ncbi:dTDP-4-dehydrorhamnose 3,5-epimerase [Fodinibius saliphilus]|uniref:dTDP-4-dehydrorhamnose 3,5-epimerase n=1 Tax=Fodinibius saliphilus TaxID=1920650 RepID=UPI001109F3FA|nr:dTDP-4-dehydrorhamnose 3,5-epimerase [Fodinibius saliphilus]
MIFKETKIDGAFVIEIEKLTDKRGFFARGYCEKEFKEQGILFEAVQANIGYNKFKHTIRGLHYQVKPHAEAKLVRCVKGEVWDVIVDVRPESPTYKQWLGVELTENNHTMLFIPEGCAHGYQTLVDNTEIYYMVSAFYAPEAEQGIRWDDQAFNIEWRETEQIFISDKDQKWENYNSSPQKV